MSNEPALTFDDLADLAEGRLAPPAAAAVRQRAAAHPWTSERLAALERTIGLMRADKGYDAPGHVVQRALRLMRPPAAARGATSGSLRRLVGRVRFDSAQAPMAAGLRAAGEGPRRLLFSAEPYEVDLLISPAAGRWRLSGQLIGPDEPGGAAELAGSAGILTTPLNELSEFTLPPVEPGRYTLVVRQPATLIIAAEIDLGPAPL